MTNGLHHAPSRSVRSVVPGALAGMLLLGASLSCGGSGGAGPTATPRSAFGVIGGSLSRLAVQGYNDLGGRRGWPDERMLEYGGAVISVWAAEIGQAGARTWPLFQELLDDEPGTDQIWWHLLVRRRPGPPPAALSAQDRQLVINVAAEIRRRVGPTLPIFVSPLPRFGPEVECEPVGPTDERISRLMVDFAVASGLAERGPALAPITSRNNNGPSDPCHQGPLGREEHGRQLRGFFGG